MEPALPYPSPALLGLRHVAVPLSETNFKSPLNELYDKHSHCGNLEYRVNRVPGAQPTDSVQWACRCAQLEHWTKQLS